VRNLTKALTVVSLLAPVSGHSLGIGDIRVRSALNQNLSAEIAIVAARGENPSNIKVNLAPAEKFDEAGVPWSYFLSKIKFQPIVKSNGSMVIKVTSREALKEPYLNFLLEVSWPKGNLYREFTVLVDPPTEYQAPTAYQEPAYQEPAYPLTSRYENTPPQEEYIPRQRPVRRSSRPRRSAAGGHGGQVVTRRNDTLWNVAERTRGSGVSVEQMMMALYEKNPQAFYQQNVNALSAGKRLKVPEKSAVQQTSRQEALAEFSQHNEAWNNNRSGVPVGQTQVAREDDAENQLKLEAPADTTVAANESVSPSSEESSGTKNTAPTQATADKDTAKQTSAPVDDALQGKIAALEKQMATMQELIALKDKQLADIQNPSQATPPPAPITPPAPVVEQPKPEPLPPVAPVAPVPPVQVVTPPIKPAQPVVPPKPIVKPIVKKAVQAPAPVAEESDSSLLWIIGGIVATFLSLFGWLWWRKKKIIQDTDAESMFGSRSTLRGSDSTGLRKASQSAGAISAESSFLNDFKASDFESFESFNVDHGDIDPVAEADVYLAYGRYQQAEDLITQAIKDFPDRDECKLKLLEIYHANSNKIAFESYAAELAAAGKMSDKAFWGKVAELGKDVNPDSELFLASAYSSAAVFATESEELSEKVLFDSSVAGREVHINPVDEAEHLGAATFEVSDDAEESLFDAPHEELESQQHDEFIVEAGESPSLNDEQDFDLAAFEEESGTQQDNESIDFDLGPYPDTNKKMETVKPSLTDSQTIASNASNHQLENSDNNIEFESYEFDFTTDKPETAEPVKPEMAQATETWDAEQTIDFAMDEAPETDTFGNDTMDFSFDLDPQQLDSDTLGNEDQGFMVSDLTDMDELETKLDLAKAYIDMGDERAAKEIIDQVLEHGSAEQKKTAQTLLEDLG
jgi:pilus assembly protein FimV